MKLFFNLFGMAAAAALGYYAEPSLRFQLTGIQPSSREEAEGKTTMIRSADGGPAIPLSSLSADQLPATVLLKSSVKLSDPVTGASMTLDAGKTAKLVRVEGANLLVSPGEGPYLGRIPLTETDLLSQLGKKTTLTANMPPSSPVTPMQETPPAPEMAAPPVATAEPATMPTSATVPDPTPPPAPVAEVGPVDVVKTMQESIKASQIKEFKFDDVLEWKAEADEVIDGENFQIGSVSYKAETFLGVKTLQGKALIKGGKVVRWLGKKSGLEIK